MNTPASGPSSAVCPPPSAIGFQPIVLLLALALRIRAAFGECFQSTTRLIAQARAQIALQCTWSRSIRAIDDELERDFPLFQRALANDPPALRRRLLADLRRLHARTETLAPEVEPACPQHLLGDR